MVNSELSGKVAIVTGAGRMRGIGRATAVILARMGSHVVAVSYTHLTLPTNREV